MSPIRRHAVLRRVTSLFVLSLCISVSAEAQKRRSAPSPVNAPPPVGGDCHEFGLVTPGLKATYHSEAQGGNADFTITWISDTLTQTKTTQVVTTAQGTADVETTLDGEVVGNLRALKHIDLKTSMTVPVIGKVTTEVEIDFVPSLVAGPAEGWCVGNTWTVARVTETITTRTPGLPTQTQVVTTIASTGEVLAVGETITVPAGTFETVKYRGAIVSSTSVQTAITWVSMEHDIVVKQDTIDGGGTVTSTTTLTNLQNAGLRSWAPVVTQ
jgi:hypothetical protein